MNLRWVHAVLILMSAALAALFFIALLLLPVLTVSNGFGIHG